MCFWQCLYCDCGCLRDRVLVCDCVCLYGYFVVFVCGSGHVCMVFVVVFVDVYMFVNVCACMVIVCVCVGVCMFVIVCDCMVIVLCLYVSAAMFVL